MSVEMKVKMPLKSLSRIASRLTIKAANTACFCWQGQPKESEKIKKLRKF